jgi:hypothetical protein
MSRKPELPRALDQQGESRALLRARQRAREVAARTGTPLVIYRDGKIERINVAAAPAPAAARED